MIKEIFDKRFSFQMWQETLSPHSHHNNINRPKHKTWSRGIKMASVSKQDNLNDGYFNIDQILYLNSGVLIKWLN